MGKLEALREAQLWMLKEGNTRGLVSDRRIAQRRYEATATLLLGRLRLERRLAINAATA